MYALAREKLISPILGRASRPPHQLRLHPVKMKERSISGFELVRRDLGRIAAQIELEISMPLACSNRQRQLPRTAPLRTDGQPRPRQRSELNPCGTPRQNTHSGGVAHRAQRGEFGDSSSVVVPPLDKGGIDVARRIVELRQVLLLSHWSPE